ncbi:MAG: virulence protein [Ruminococcus sp.]|nr:virulence protein [Ruminococcus sp.]
MTIYYEITGPRRKQLAAAVGEFAGVTPVYQFTPSYAFAVDQYTITRAGNLEFSDRTDSEEVEKLIDFLDECGFSAIPVETEDAETLDGTDAEESEEPAEVISAADEAAPSANEVAPSSDETAPAPTEKPLKGSGDCGEEESDEDCETAPDASEGNLTETDRLTISLPLDSFSESALGNLKRLVASKETLIKHSIGVNALPIEVTDKIASFPWFPFAAKPDEVTAYTQLVTALCEMAKNQKRITAKDTAPENERYAFRCFLLRLGFIGKEYSATRKILLRNLPGNSAFKGGQRNAESN